MKKTLLFAIFIFIFSCKVDNTAMPKSSAKELLSFSFKQASNPNLSMDIEGVIVGKEIKLTLAPRTKVDALKASFTSSALSSITVGGVKQENGATINNFTNPITYRVTAEDGTTNDYTVTVTVAKSNDKSITTFAFTKADNPTFPTDVMATINGKDIAVLLPSGTKTDALKSSFMVSPLSIVSINGINQESGKTVNDFSKPVIYKVTAEDGTTNEYTVTVTVTKSSEKQITAFTLATPISATVAIIDQDNRTIKAIVESETDLTKLIPTIVFSAKANVSPASGVAQNFTNAVIYTVTAENESTQTYEVKIEKRAVTSVPSALGLSTFYKKYIDANGIPVVSSNKVPNAALMQAREIINQVLEKIITKRPDIMAKAVQNKLRVAIMAETEVTTDIPEHSDLYTAFPGTDWNTRARGLGATVARPACSCAEESLLCYATDRYSGEDILVHEFAHSIHLLGINYADTKFNSELNAVYNEAISKGLWANTYAATNYLEYWAEGVQDWFDLNAEAIPSNGIHNNINTRAELKIYDPKLYELISRYYDEPTKKVSCQKITNKG